MSWEGWATCATFLLAILGCRFYFGSANTGNVAMAVCFVSFLIVMFLTGTKPGGPNSN